MLDARSWLEREGLIHRRWLVLGKGPSFDRYHDLPTDDFAVLALNHAVRAVPATAVHVVDLEVLEQCADVIAAGPGAVIVPWRPHLDGVEVREDLAALTEQHRLLGELRNAGRLVHYNLRPSHGAPVSGAPTAETRSFSGVAAIALLAECGVRTVRTLGLDGGQAYSDQFRDLTRTTLLANGRPDFNAQFEELAKLVGRYALDLAPLDREHPIRIFVGATERQRIPARVLEYSIRKHASRSVDVRPAYSDGAELLDGGTDFSLYRFTIPQRAGFRGRAIYLDSDMLVFRDIAELWDLPSSGADVVSADLAGGDAAARFSVLLLECGRLEWSIDAIRQALATGDYTYRDLLYELAIVPPTRLHARIPPAWNSLERFDRGRTALLHYTHVPTQPWLNAMNPLGHLWVEHLMEAVRDGFIARKEVEDAVTLGHVRPSLLVQLDRGMPDAWALSNADRRLDVDFLPPHVADSVESSETVGHHLRALRARALWRFSQTPLYPRLATARRHLRRRTYLYMGRALVKRLHRHAVGLLAP